MTLAQSHLWTALRYVELNPVRAGIVGRPEEYPWSNARSHVSGEDRGHMLDMDFWREAGGAERWQVLLGGAEEELELKRLRSTTYAGKPFGSKEFIEQLRNHERETGGHSSGRTGRKTVEQAELCPGPRSWRPRASLLTIHCCMVNVWRGLFQPPSGSMKRMFAH
jgi:hypothetical protein